MEQRKIGTDATISCGIKQLSEDPTWPDLQVSEPPQKQTNRGCNHKRRAEWPFPVFVLFLGFLFSLKKKKKKPFNLDLPCRDLWGKSWAFRGLIVCLGVLPSLQSFFSRRSSTFERPLNAASCFRSSLADARSYTSHRDVDLGDDARTRTETPFATTSSRRLTVGPHWPLFTFTNPRGCRG